MWHLTTLLFSTLLLSCALAQDEAVPSCGADVTINSAYYGHGSFVYNDIMVLNTGACAITQLFVQLTLPPGAEAFAYHNISNQTGELLGLVTPVKVGSMQKGGSVVLNSIRTPLVSVASIICESTCDKGSNTVAPASAASVRRSKPAAPSQGSSITIKVETEWGANSRWIALSLLDDIATSEVWLTSAKGSRQLMKREQWTTKTAYTFSSGVAMELPISLELKSFYGETIVLKNFITSFEYTVADTDDSYASSPVVDVIDHSLRLVIHPASNSEWVGLTPYGTLASRVSSVAVRAANAEFVTMTRADVGFYTVSSPDQAITVPVFAQVTFDDGTSLQVDVVDF